MKILSVVLVFGLLIIGCNKESNPVNNLPTGNIKGTVTILNEPNNNNSGVKIALDGTNYSAISSREGNYEIKNVPEGSYLLSFFKQGYFIMNFDNFKVFGNKTHEMSNITLTSIPSLYVTQLNASVIDSTRSIYLQGNLSGVVVKVQTVNILISKSITIKNEIIKATSSLSYGATSGESNFSCYFNLGYDSTLVRGDTLQAIAFVSDGTYTPEIYTEIGGYYYFNTHGVTLSNKVSVIAP